MRFLSYILLAALMLTAATTYADRRGKTSNSKKSKEEKKGSDKKKSGKVGLYDTYWRLADMNGKPVNIAAEDKDVFIMLTEKGKKLSGFAGCNTIGGSFTAGKENVISFDAITTRMACPDLETENYTMNVLRKANRYELNGDHLLLFSDNMMLALFEAKEFGATTEQPMKELE